MLEKKEFIHHGAIKIKVMYANPVSDKFQDLFNKAASKKNFDKAGLEHYAGLFFKTVLRMVVKEEADHCPFPEYLVQNFKKVNS